MAHAKKVETVITYTTTDGTVFTVLETANAYEAAYTKNLVGSSLESEQKSKLKKLADGYANVNPYFYYISRGGEYTEKRLGLKFSKTTALDVVKNLLITSPDIMEKILFQINDKGKK